VGRHRQAEQAQIAGHVGHAAVEEDPAGLLPGQAVGAHLPAEHLLGEGSGVVPGQRPAADGGLVLDHAASGLVGAGVAEPGQRIDQGTLACAGAAGQDDKAGRFVGVDGHGVFLRVE